MSDANGLKHQPEAIVQKPRGCYRTPLYRLTMAAATRCSCERVNLPTKIAVPLISLDRIKPEHVQWLWPGRVPLGKITILQGDPGIGKSTIALDIASRVSTKQPMPDGSLSDSENAADVLLLSAEDGPADTIRPRLDALGADQRRVTIPGENRHLQIPSELSLIQDALQRLDAKLCVIDPLAAFLDTSINSWNNQHVRRALAPLAGVAQQTGAAILIVDHLNKREGIPAVHRGSGSIGFNAAARSVLMASKHPEEPETFVLSNVKCNLCAPPISLAYRMADANNGVLKLEWLGECPFDADELVTAAFKATSNRKLQAAVDWLRVRLASASALSKVVEKEALEMGFSARTLARARKQLGVISQPSGLQGEWVISLPAGIALLVK